MITAAYQHKQLVIDILSASFNDNKSVNFIIQPGRSQSRRLQSLMSYSFDICYNYGKVYLSDNKEACALVLFPEKRKGKLLALRLDLTFIFKAIGLRRLPEVLRRNAKINSVYPDEPMYYLWFIGVSPEAQKRGAGTQLLKEVLKDADSMRRGVFLETSTLKNIPWYQQSGFQIYHELDLGYTLFFFSRPPSTG